MITAACHALLNHFENPVATLAGLLEGYKNQLDAAKKALDKKDSAGKKQLDEQGKLLRELTGAINTYQNQYTKSQVGEPLQDYKQALKDWHHLLENFPPIIRRCRRLVQDRRSGGGRRERLQPDAGALCGL